MGNPEARELMLEILAHWARGRYEMVDLWVNYDCNIEGEDLFERFVRFLSRVSGLARSCEEGADSGCRRECSRLARGDRRCRIRRSSSAWIRFLLLWAT